MARMFQSGQLKTPKQHIVQLGLLQHPKHDIVQTESSVYENRSGNTISPLGHQLATHWWADVEKSFEKIKPLCDENHILCDIINILEL